MNEFTLYESFSFIDEELIERSEGQREDKRRGIGWRTVTAACLCLAAGAIIWLHGGLLTKGGDKANTGISQGGAVYQASLYKADSEDEKPILVSGVQEGSDLLANVDGKSVSALHIASADALSADEAQELAYMDPETAEPELRDKIMAARETIIYSKSWVADGYAGFIENVETGALEQLPTFSELFPGWDIPAIEAKTGSVTEDGLGADLLYGVAVRIVELRENGFAASVLIDEGMLGFREGQLVSILSPADGLANSLELHVGDTVYVTYYGKDCSKADGKISAKSILSEAP